MSVLNRYEEILVNHLMVNPENDRHGSLEDEIDAMNWLLGDSKAKIKTLAKDIAEKGYVFSAPLVSKVDDETWVLHDGNRRTTCVKMLNNPTLANDITWQRFFERLSQKHRNNIPQKLVCRIEDDQEVIDDIVFRLHAGGESGVGTVAWSPRQQQNHSIRTGKQETPSLGIQIENLMKEKGLLNEHDKLPIRNIERLLSSKKYHQLVGIQYKKGGNIEFIYPEKQSLRILDKVCKDLINKKVTIDNLIKNTQKDAYFSEIAAAGYELNNDAKSTNKKPTLKKKPKKEKRRQIKKPRHYLISQETAFIFDDSDDLHRIKDIIEELQTLPLKRYINSISVLFRLLVEASTNHYNEINKIHARSDKIHVTVQAALDHMVTKEKIYGKDAEVLKKFSQKEEIISAHTFHTYVHSHKTTPSEQHICAMWDSFKTYIQCCISERATEQTQEAA